MPSIIEHPGYAAFFDALVDGRIRLGQTLTQEELGGIIGLKLSPMREVTALLEAEGLIQVKKRIGLTIFYPDVRFVGGTFQYREILEIEGLRRFSEMVTGAWVKRMLVEHEQVMEFVRENPEPRLFAPEIKRVEQAFHHSFINAFDNDQIRINHRRNEDKMYLLRLLNPDSVGPSNTIKSMTEHLEVIRCLERRDADAAVEALRRHIQGVLHRVLTH